MKHIEDLNMIEAGLLQQLFGNQGVCVGKRRKYPGATIVTDSVTSNGLTAFITAQVCQDTALSVREGSG